MTVASPTRFAPRRWLGGTSEFGIALPDAAPTPSTMYAPRGVALTDDAVIVADTGNHRILIWWDNDPSDHSDADVVLGQPDMTTEGPGLLFLPTGLVVHDGRLVVADAWHHRILVWDEVPRRSSVPPSLILGQGPRPTLADDGEGCGPERFYWPFGIAVIDDVFWVADTGNRRVLGWEGGLPDPGQPADRWLGQPHLDARGENRDGPVSADSFRWPHALTAAGGALFVADAGNHRVLGWWGDPEAERPADLVLGQPSFSTADENPYAPQGARTFRFPYGVATGPGGELIVSDTSNNRLAVIDDPLATLSAEPVGAAVDRVLGQPDLDARGENRWDRVVPDSMCWPYGLGTNGPQLGMADSGNNRVMLWSAEA